MQLPKLKHHLLFSAIVGLLICTSMLAQFNNSQNSTYDDMPGTNAGQMIVAKTAGEKQTNHLHEATGTTPSDASDAIFSVITAEELEQLEAQLIFDLDRLYNFDESLTGAEIHALENKLAMLIAQSPEVLALVREQLDASFVAQRPNNIYFLERILSTSKTGIDALVQDYQQLVISDDPDHEFYAMQGLANFQNFIPESERLLLMEKAMQHLDKYDNLYHFGPALRFITQAMSRNPAAIPTMYSEVMLNLIENRQIHAKTRDEQFFTAQSLLTTAPKANRADNAQIMLYKFANQGTIEAVLESIEIGEFTLTEGVASALQNALTSSSIPDNTADKVNSVLGVAS